jgi:ribonuclease VapC
MIIDSSIILAIYFQETHGDWAAEQLDLFHDNLKMSTVNLTEVLIRLEDRQPENFPVLATQLLNSSIKFIAPDVQQSQIAASTRSRFPINLGDCFVYALAKVNQDKILTLDSDFKKTDAELIFPF